MNTNHTPGPWNSASTGNHQGLVISEANGANVATTYDKADATLIAAAPDMLAALQAILPHINAGEALLARTAINKALGK